MLGPLPEPDTSVVTSRMTTARNGAWLARRLVLLPRTALANRHEQDFLVSTDVAGGSLEARTLPGASPSLALCNSASVQSEWSLGHRRGQWSFRTGLSGTGQSGMTTCHLDGDLLSTKPDCCGRACFTNACTSLCLFWCQPIRGGGFAARTKPGLLACSRRGRSHPDSSR